MKRSRRVWLKLMGSIAVGAASMSLSPSQARSQRHAGHKAKRKPEQTSPSGGFGDAPRTIARYDNGPAHGGG